MTAVIGLTSECEVVLQPFGSFLVNRSRNRFDVLNKSGTGILMALHRPMELDQAVAWASDRGHDPVVVADLIAALTARGYVGAPADGPRVSYVGDAGILKATRADIEVTNRCNLKCVYCYAEVNRSKDELSAKEWITLLTGMYEHGLRAVLFSGGEPFLHKEFFQLLEWAAPRLVVEINSNGAYITGTTAALLADLDIKQVQISVDSAEPDYHDSVRGRGSHARAVRAIRTLVANGVPVQASAVVTSANRNVMPELQRFIEGEGARFKGDPVTRTGFAKEIPDDRWERDFQAASKDRFATPNADAELGFEPLCQSQVGYVAVSHQGILKPCNMREGFFEPTGGVLLHGAETRWWQGFYGSTGLASLATAAAPVDPRRAHQLRESARGYLCELQLAVTDAGHAPRPVMVDLAPPPRR